MRDQAIELMLGFAERTGISGDHRQRRYLWTDAYALCNFVGLYFETGERRFLDLAHRTVEHVHHTLGRHRAADARRGWISGLDEQAGELHPTIGGLRIGKPHAERGPGEPFDEGLEWERDGQYFHYLTVWMHALDQLGRATHDPEPNRWARELAATAHRRFVYGTHPRRMYWKLSIDLSRPLVTSMGHHDPLDGYLACVELAATASSGPDLATAQLELAQMIGGSLATADPLGLGGLLFNAHRAARLGLPAAFVETLLDGADAGLRLYIEGPERHAPAAHRLAFRELGLAIGLAAVAAMESAVTARFRRFLSLSDELTSFWARPASRLTRPWLEHADINDVMLATSLAPDGYLTLHNLPMR